MTIGNVPAAGSLLVSLLYGLAAALARGAARRLRRDRDRPAAWRAIALTLALLAIVRLFDVEEHLARMVATSAWHAGWYGNRASVQWIAVGAALAIGVLGVAAGAASSRRLGAALAVALVATALLAVLAALRIISLHATDHLLRAGWGPITVSRSIEGGALAILLAVARLSGRPPRRR